MATAAAKRTEKMGSERDAGRTPRLVVDLNTGVVLVDGQRAEPTPTQFKVLAVLVTRLGEAVPSDELAELVWPGMAMTADQVRWHVWRLREALGDNKREHKIVGNRHGFGYFIDLPSEAVVVVSAPGEATSPAPEAAVLDQKEPDEPADPESVTPEPEEPQPPPDPAPAARQARRVLLPLAIALALALVGTSWVVGFELSRRRAPEPAPSPSPSPRVVLPPSPAAAEEDRDRRTRRQRASQRARRQQAREGTATTTRIPPAAQAQQQTSGEGTAAPRRSPAKSRQEPKLPPPPTSLLYHLYNADKDDHFVTTDGNVARQQEGRGYEGGAIARVYTYREQNTKPIATNHGTAYIFVSDNAKTDPASRTTALYYATDNEGDFFYTTRRSQAEKEGWESWVIGYARRL